MKWQLGLVLGLTAVKLLSPDFALASPGQPYSLVASSDGSIIQLAPPLSRMGHQAAYDALRNEMVVVGGWTESVWGDASFPVNETWVLSLDSPQAWRQLAPSGSLPPGRFGFAAISDQARDRVVIFGGDTWTAYANDVWSLSLGSNPQWTQLNPAGTPPAARTGHSAIYDPIADRMIVFGGWDGGTYRNDVWELRFTPSVEWHEISADGTLPLSRRDASAVYDPLRQRMILFGGSRTADYRRDAWALSLNGAPTWSSLSTTGGPPGGRAAHAAVYDPVQDRMFVFGGFDGTNYLNNMWSLSLATNTWSLVTPAGGAPSARSNTSLIYSATNGNFVLYDGTTRLSDVWRLSTQGAFTWTQLTIPPGNPPDRYYCSFVLSSSTSSLLLFGGLYENTRKNDLWKYTASGTSQWSQVTPSGSAPPARQSQATAMDQVHSRMLVFGGIGSSDNPLNDVWNLTIAPSLAWSRVLPSGSSPDSRFGASLIYDEARNRFILFGGGPYGLFYNDSWELVLEPSPAWRRLTPAGAAPAARSYHTAIYDAARDRMLIFGGLSNSGKYNDVWQLSLSGNMEWSQLQIEGSSPDPSGNASAVYLPTVDAMFLDDGEDDENHALGQWVLFLSGTPSWKAVSLSGPIPPAHRKVHPLVYDAVQGRILEFRSNALWDVRPSPTLRPDAVWPTCTGTPCLRFRIEDFGGAETVASLRLSYAIAKTYTKAIETKPIVNGFVTFSQEELASILWPSGLDNPIPIESIDLLSGDASPRKLGHIGFKYAYDDLVYNRSRDAYIFFHNDRPPMDSSHPAWWFHEHGWGYYDEGEYPVSLLVPPEGDIAASIGGDKLPVLFVHGISGTYPSFGSIPEAVNGATYEGWVFSYPYDQLIDMNADLLGVAIDKLLSDGGLYGFSGYTASRVSLVTHSMGGLVARWYIQSSQSHADKVRKLLMLSPPNHGSHISYRLFYEPEGLVGSVTEPFWTHDPQAPAHQQMTPASDFQFLLNGSAPRRLGMISLDRDYLVIAGSKNTSVDMAHQEIWHQDDDVVAVSSASLLDRGIPLAVVEESHSGILWSSQAPSDAVKFLAEGYDPGNPGFSTWVKCRMSSLESTACDGLTGLNSDAGLLQLRVFNGGSNVDHYKVTVGEAGILEFRPNASIGGSDSMKRIGYGSQNYFSRHTLYLNDMRLANVEPGTYRAKLYEKRGMLWNTSWVPVGVSNAFSYDDMCTSMAALTFSAMASEVAKATNGVMVPPLGKALSQYEFTADADIDTLIFNLSSPISMGEYAQHGMSLTAPDNTEIDPGYAYGASDVEYEENGSAGFAQYLITHPQPGVWRIHHYEGLEEPVLYAFINSGLRANVALEDSSYVIGDTLACRVSFVGAEGCTEARCSLVGHYVSADSTVNQDLGSIALENLGTGQYRGVVLNAGEGEYTFALSCECDKEGGETIHRETVAATLVGRSANALTGVGQDGAGLHTPESAFRITSVAPNPFNPRTVISFAVPERQRVTLSVYDISGRRRATLLDGLTEKGEHTLAWSAQDDRGRPLASGVYFVRLVSAGHVQTRKIAVLK